MLEKQKNILPSDEEIVKIALVDSDYFAILVERYEQKFLRYIYRILGRNEIEAEDILQEAFIKIYQHLNDFDSSLKFSSWGYRIVRNETIDKIRQQNKNRDLTIKLNEEEFIQIADKFKLEQKLDDQLLKQKILNAINSLKIKYREPLILFLLEEKSYEEISDILRVPVGTVGSLINRGKKKLKTNLK